MTDTLTITINKRDYEIPRDFGSTITDLLAHTPYDETDEWELYRREAPHIMTTEADECSTPLELEDGDLFTLKPKYITAG